MNPDNYPCPPPPLKTETCTIEIPTFSAGRSHDGYTQLQVQIKGLSSDEHLEVVQVFTEFLQTFVRSKRAIEKYGPGKKDS